MAKQQPGDALVWYGLASEHFKAESWNEAAAALQKVVQLNPDYTAAYQMLGTALLNQGKLEDARRAWEQGIEVAGRTGAWKARQHMEGLMAGVGDKQAGAEFCE